MQMGQRTKNLATDETVLPERHPGCWIGDIVQPARTETGRRWKVVGFAWGRVLIVPLSRNGRPAPGLARQRVPYERFLRRWQILRTS